MSFRYGLCIRYTKNAGFVSFRFCVRIRVGLDESQIH